MQVQQFTRRESYRSFNSTTKGSVSGNILVCFYSKGSIERLLAASTAKCTKILLNPDPDSFVEKL